MTASPTSSKGGYRKSFVDFRGGRQDDYNDERWASASPRVSYLTASPRGQPGVGRQAREATAPGVRRSESMRVNGAGSNRAQSPARPGRPQSHYGVAREPNPRAVHRSHTLRGHPSDIHSVMSPRPGSVASSVTDQRSLMSPDMTSSQSSVMSYTPEERCLLIASCLEVGSRVAVSLGKRPGNYRVFIHYKPANCCRNSRLVVNEDDLMWFKNERKLPCIGQPVSIFVLRPLVVEKLSLFSEM